MIRIKIVVNESTDLFLAKYADVQFKSPVVRAPVIALDSYYGIRRTIYSGGYASPSPCDLGLTVVQRDQMPEGGTFLPISSSNITLFSSSLATDLGNCTTFGY